MYSFKGFLSGSWFALIGLLVLTARLSPWWLIAAVLPLAVLGVELFLLDRKRRFEALHDQRVFMSLRDVRALLYLAYRAGSEMKGTDFGWEVFLHTEMPRELLFEHERERRDNGKDYIEGSKRKPPEGSKRKPPEV